MDYLNFLKKWTQLMKMPIRKHIKGPPLLKQESNFGKRRPLMFSGSNFLKLSLTQKIHPFIDGILMESSTSTTI